MDRSDANISGCNFGEDAVLYLYGELPDSDRVTFESHLVDCTACTDEFAAMASARYEVYEWKKLEFDSIATPHFEIPFGREEEAVTWTDRVKSAFDRRWAVPGLAFAGLAVISIFAATFLLSGGPDDIAKSTGPVDTPAVSNVEALTAAPPPVVTSSAESRTRVSRSDDARRVAVPTVVRAEGRSTPRNVTTAQPKRIATKPESTRAVKVDMPRLNGFPDDEDTSLRLAELFDDGESRD